MMKKFFMPIFAALALTGCSDDVPGSGNGNEDPGISGGQFLAVNIVTQGSGASRAEANDVVNSDYEDGVGDENKVNAVRLYFFTATGDPITIKKGATANFYDIPLDSLSYSKPANHEGTVEKVINSVVIVEKGERLPAKVVAIINPILSGPANIALDNTSKSLSDLQSRCVNYADYANGRAKDASNNVLPASFVMSNSVYADANGLVDATNISPEHYFSTHKEAKEHPVEIYVERTVAKVRLNASGLKNKKKTVGDKTLYELLRAIKNDKGEIVNDVPYTVAEKDATSAVPGGTTGNAYTQKQVYVSLDGWDISADVSLAWFFKHVNMNWQGTYLGSDIVWNDPKNHRSYWADVCNPEINENQYYAYSDGTHFKLKKFNDTECIYCNENAERPGGSNLKSTKVLIKATICDENGNALMISEYGGSRFIDGADLIGLKNRYIEMYKGLRSELPWREGELDKNGNKTYVQLSEVDITMRPIEKIKPSDIESKLEDNDEMKNGKYVYASGRYYVYPCLTDEAAKKTWYKEVRYANAEHTKYDLGDVETAAELEKSLLDLSHAMVWNNGQTYYYVDIKHLGNNANGNWGTVRNHLYDIDINKIYGLGTPVYDDKLVIEPEKPENDETFIAARVRILQWRVVDQDVDLDWN